MEKILLTTFIMLSVQLDGFAQVIPSIQTDRPDQTECPFITPRHYFQFENGFSYEQNNKNSYTIVAPTILTRYGINNFIELRLITEYIQLKENAITISGISPILIGFKTKLFEEKGIFPTTAFIAHLGFPKVASPAYRLNYFYPEFRFTMQHTINQRQSLSYNLGAEWEGETNKPTFIYTLTSGYSLTEKIGVYFELFGYIPQTGVPDNRSDLGMTYLFNDNHQLDISGGFGLSSTSPDYYFSVGYSFRFKT
ncbi:transporter [Flavobacterium cellulosilyticum]|uniref:Transporter n=1 Tax=Flavobacterium cellulosilyticum TaxID=2541731 RepID=A0A4R5CI79_9FLAO|nr:transporter [Flavobacterium cellulosilyticum]TDD99475.1 transporter [Flavobacterium cellulosilyticum]